MHQQLKQIMWLRDQALRYELYAEQALGYWANEAECEHYNQLAAEAHLRAYRLFQHLAAKARLN